MLNGDKSFKIDLINCLFILILDGKDGPLDGRKK